MNQKHICFKTIVVCSLSLLFFASSKYFAQTADINKKAIEDTDMKYVETFKINKCNKITLHYYKLMTDSRDGIAPKSKEITDKATLDKILLLVNQLPDKGTKMIKMGNVPLLDVIITTDKGETIYFSYFQGIIKTTDTSFYSDPRPKEEKILYGLLMSILNK
jgi:hypothetical protein